jgi:hypothetical protein
VSDEKKPGGSEYDRMSITSLKRELEAQKSKTETARAEAKERLADRKKPGGAPWGLIAGIAGAALIFAAVGVYFGGNFLSSIGVPLPAFVPVDALDAGSFALPDYVGLDGGPEFDAGVARSPTGRRPIKNRDPNNGLDFGESDDPIDGLDELE